MRHEPRHLLLGQARLDVPADALGNHTIGSCQSELFESIYCQISWGGWGSTPRPADYEKYGPTLPMLYLHGYHGVVPPMALIALYARVPRSTNRSTPYRGDHRMPATERDRRPRCASPAGSGLPRQSCGGKRRGASPAYS
jgi:hypothetical protein